jgi:hypothetical protein
VEEEDSHGLIVARVGSPGLPALTGAKSRRRFGLEPLGGSASGRGNRLGLATIREGAVINWGGVSSVKASLGEHRRGKQTVNLPELPQSELTLWEGMTCGSGMVAGTPRWGSTGVFC